MKPRLYPSDAVSFKNMGYGEIDAISCVVTEALNGEYDLHMTMLNTDRNFQNIQVGSIIAAKPNGTDPIQAFCIEEIGKAINGEVEIYATHIAQFRSKLIPVANYTATSLSNAIDKAFTNSLESNPFTFTTDKTVATSYTLNAPRSFRELMGGKEGSLLDIYGGEYYFDNFDIQLLLHRGRDNGVYIFYGKNMTDFKADDMFSWNDSATGVVPFWYSEEDGLVKGDVQYSQYVDYYPYKRTIVKDFTEDFETKPTKAQLEAMALSWITNKGLNMANISVAFDDLVTDNKGKLISLGDTVHVINSMYDVDYTSRIVKTVFNVLLERYDSVEVGQLKQTINEAISDTASGDTINKTYDQTEVIKAGDVFKFSSNYVESGFISSSSTALLFTVHFAKPIKATSVTIDKLTLRVRYGTGGYILLDVDVTTGYTLSATIVDEMGITINVESPSKYQVGGQNVPNNCAVSVDIRANSQFTFS